MILERCFHEVRILNSVISDRGYNVDIGQVLKKKHEPEVYSEYKELFFKEKIKDKTVNLTLSHFVSLLEHKGELILTTSSPLKRNHCDVIKDYVSFLYLRTKNEKTFNFLEENNNEYLLFEDIFEEGITLIGLISEEYKDLDLEVDELHEEIVVKLHKEKYNFTDEIRIVKDSVSIEQIEKLFKFIIAEIKLDESIIETVKKLSEDFKGNITHT